MRCATTRHFKSWWPTPKPDDSVRRMRFELPAASVSSRGERRAKAGMKTLACERDAAEILGRLRALRPDSARRWGRVSAHQMVCHLSDGYRLLTGELTSPPVATPLPRPMMKWIALYVPVRWPAGVPTTPELDQAGGGTRPADFAADIAQLEALLTRIAAERSGRLA